MNNRCISCGLLLKGEKFMHEKCIKSLFSVSKIPSVGFSLKEISVKAQECVGKLSISGVRPKLSAKINRKNAKVEIVHTGGRFIIKPQTDRFPQMPENENLCMTIFEIAGIKTALHGIIPLADNSNAYIVRRFDREGNEKIHFEDMQSVLDEDDKYEGSAEKIGDAIKSHAKFPGLEIQNFFKIVIMNFIVGNGDAHLKNYGFIYEDDGNKILSPCYDIVSSKLVIRKEEDSALTINGKKNKLKAGDFHKLAEAMGIDERISLNIIKEITEVRDTIISFVEDYPFMYDMKRDCIKILQDGYERINS
ncbi:MAG: type II toxin-antitoxin system HipA family toxin [bacterium]